MFDGLILILFWAVAIVPLPKTVQAKRHMWVVYGMLFIVILLIVCWWQASHNWPWFSDVFLLQVVWWIVMAAIGYLAGVVMSTSWYPRRKRDP